MKKRLAMKIKLKENTGIGENSKKTKGNQIRVLFVFDFPFTKGSSIPLEREKEIDF